MTQPINQLQKKISDHDHGDAMRMVDSAVSLIATAALAAPAARELAIVQLRGLMANHPYADGMLESVVQYIESQQLLELKATGDRQAAGA